MAVNNTDTLLSAEALYYAYADKRQVIRDVTVSLRAGRICALIGVNGAGKTTLLQLLAGILRPTSGRVRVAINDAMTELNTLPLPLRAQVVGLLVQHVDTPFPFTVRAAVALGRHDLPADDRAVTKAMSQCDVLHFAEANVRLLSGGEQRRVMLARLFARIGGRRRQVVLLDEPFAGLDIAHQVCIADALSQLATIQQAAVLVATHDINIIARIADDACLLSAAGAIHGAFADTVTADTLTALLGVAMGVDKESGTFFAR